MWEDIKDSGAPDFEIPTPEVMEAARNFLGQLNCEELPEPFISPDGVGGVSVYFIPGIFFLRFQQLENGVATKRFLLMGMDNNPTPEKVLLEYKEAMVTA